MALAWLLLAGRNSPASAQELAALHFLSPEVWSELLRSALLVGPGALHPTPGQGRGERLERG